MAQSSNTRVVAGCSLLVVDKGNRTYAYVHTPIYGDNDIDEAVRSTCKGETAAALMTAYVSLIEDVNAGLIPKAELQTAAWSAATCLRAYQLQMGEPAGIHIYVRHDDKAIPSISVSLDFYEHLPTQAQRIQAARKEMTDALAAGNDAVVVPQNEVLAMRGINLPW